MGEVYGERMRVASWNVNSLRDVGDQKQLVKMLNLYKIEIAAISEVRLLNEGVMNIMCENSSPDDVIEYTMVYKGNDDDERHEYGVAIVMSPRIAKAWNCGGRIVHTFRNGVLKARAIHIEIPLKRKRSLHVISVYAPTNMPKHRDLTTEFYTELDKIVQRIPTKDIILLMGDFNARVTRLNTCEVVGRFTIDPAVNFNGEQLVSFAQMHKLSLMNTMFAHKRIHMGTWKHPRTDAWHMLDYIITQQKFRSYVEDVRVYKGANVDSDHYMVVAVVHIHSLNYQKARLSVLKRVYNSRGLRNRDWTDFTTVMSDEYKKWNEMNVMNDVSLHDKWTSFQRTVLNVAKDSFPLDRYCVRHDWLTPDVYTLIVDKAKAHAELLQSSQDGRIAKLEAYRRLKHRVQRAVRECKVRWWDSHATQLEEHSRANNTHSVFQSIDYMQRNRARPLQTIKNKQGINIQQPEERLNRWKEYFKDVNNTPSVVNARIDQINNVVDEVPDPEPSLEEVVGAIKKLKNNKASGQDGIVSELIKYGGEGCAKWLHTIILDIWHTETVPTDWIEAIIIPLFKKGDRTDCNNYRGISLLNVTSKVFVHILLNRISRTIDGRLSETQCGFRLDRGCTDHMFNLSLLMEMSRSVRTSLFVCFIDLKKAYDSVNRLALWSVLPQYGVSRKLIRLFQSLYNDTSARVCIDGKLSSPFSIGTGVKQGCLASCILFNVLFDRIVKDVHEQFVQKGVNIVYRMDGKWSTINKDVDEWYDDWIWALMYADDVALTCMNYDDLCEAIRLFEEATQQWGMSIGVSKTKILITNPQDNVYNNLRPIFIRGEKIELVSEFCYLGRTFTSDMSLDKEISNRIAKANNVFQSLYKCVWKQRCISLKTKMKIYRAKVIPVLLYGGVTWTVLKRHTTRLDVFHNRCLRIITSISKRRHIPNMTIYQLTNEMSITSRLRKERLRWLGHIRRMNPLRIPFRLLFGCISNIPLPIGRPPLRWQDLMRSDLNDLGCLANWWDDSANRQLWRDIVENCNKKEDYPVIRERHIHELPPPLHNHALRNNNLPIVVPIPAVYTCNICHKELRSQRGLSSHRTRMHH